MSSLAAMGSEVAAGADPNERKAIERQLRDLMQRFDNLTEGAAQRMDALEQAMLVAKQFQVSLQMSEFRLIFGSEKLINGAFFIFRTNLFRFWNGWMELKRKSRTWN